MNAALASIPKLTPRQDRVCAALMARRKLMREEVDAIAGCSNAPQVMAQLAQKGLPWTCTRVSRLDRDGRVCDPGMYAVNGAAVEVLLFWGY